MPADPETVVRDFFAAFGPTIDDMISTARRYFHPDMYWASAGFDPPRVMGLDQLIADLEKARSTSGIAGFRFDLISVAADGDRVLNERFDTTMDEHGNVAHEFRLMGIMAVRDGRIAWARDYFYDTTQFAEHYLPEQHVSLAPPVLDDWVRSGR